MILFFFVSILFREESVNDVVAILGGFLGFLGIRWSLWSRVLVSRRRDCFFFFVWWCLEIRREIGLV